MNELESQHKTLTQKRIAIVGGGSSGLVTLKIALDLLPDWDIICFEKSNSICGCWGNPYPGFVSTSTKYTTQFACYPIYDASVRDDAGKSRSEFFREGEYGKYLNQFTDAFELRSRIRLHTMVEHITPINDGDSWELTIRSTENENSPSTREKFDALVICTGLAAQAKPIASDIQTLGPSDLNRPEGLGHITGKRIVVLGGGESAVDYANRLANPVLSNDVYLSLQSGIRVSPRYHPIRGVPSDFLRNRLMLSIHEDIRNWIGQRFVQARIKYQERFESWFPSAQKTPNPNIHESKHFVEERKKWALRLTLTAKDELFNMFHNKSDDFLDSVATGRIKIIGPPLDDRMKTFRQFNSNETIDIAPDNIVPAIGYRSTLKEISSSIIGLRDFYLGCVHARYSNLFLVGFARPIIGNIPSICEMQAQYVCRLIAGKVQREPNLATKHEQTQIENQERFAKLNLDAIYPVEMFPYCDEIAGKLNALPSARALGLSGWIHTQLAPASTIQYRLPSHTNEESPTNPPVYMPKTLVLFLLALKPLDAIYRMLRFMRP